MCFWNCLWWIGVSILSITIKYWSKLLDDYINLNQLDILKNKGSISKIKVNIVAKDEYNKYKIILDKVYKSNTDIGLEEANKAIKWIEAKKINNQLIKK